MRLRTRSALVCFCATLLFAVPAWCLYGVYPNDKPVKAENWPQPVLKAINAYPRVYGAGSYDGGWTFYFSGKTADANAFLAEVAQEKTAPLRVVLIPELGTAKPDFNNDKLQISYAWSLHLELYRQWAPIDRNDGESDAHYAEREKQERSQLPEYMATVYVQCAGAIDVKQLKIPLTFEASIQGTLAEMVDVHNDRREAAEADHKALAAEPPTDEPMTHRGGGLFGGSTTLPADGLFNEPATKPSAP